MVILETVALFLGVVAIAAACGFGVVTLLLPDEWRDDFAFLSRWLWSRVAGAHVLVDDPAHAAAQLMPYTLGEAGEITEEGTAQEVEV